jgi:hypothetical protein
MKYKLVCYDSDNCGFVEYLEDIPDDFICENCAGISALYNIHSTPIHTRSKPDLDKELTKLLERVNKYNGNQSQ